MTKNLDGLKLELATEVLSSGGAVRLRALGTSMLPSIWPGDFLSIEGQSSEAIVPGDIVLVARDGRFFVHRLIEKYNFEWVTRGDSLPHTDQPVPEIRVLGKVSLIQRKAKVIVPSSRVSVLGRTFAMLCRWDLFRNIALRVHSFRQRRVEERAYDLRLRHE